MAEVVFMYAVTAGVFIALAAIVFGIRASRHSRGSKSELQGGALSTGNST